MDHCGMSLGRTPEAAKFGAVCKHGQLARSCDRCEDAATIAAQAAEIERLRAALDKIAAIHVLSDDACQPNLRKAIEIAREARK